MFISLNTYYHQWTELYSYWEIHAQDHKVWNVLTLQETFRTEMRLILRHLIFFLFTTIFNGFVVVITPLIYIQAVVLLQRVIQKVFSFRNTLKYNHNKYSFLPVFLRNGTGCDDLIWTGRNNGSVRFICVTLLSKVEIGLLRKAHFHNVTIITRSSGILSFLLIYPGPMLYGQINPTS